MDYVGRAVLPAVRVAQSVPRCAAAYGASGIQPRATDAFVDVHGPVVSVNGTDRRACARRHSATRISSRNTTTEFEGGFETRGLGNRVNIELTYYSKRRTTRCSMKHRAVGCGVGDDRAPEPRVGEQRRASKQR